MADSTIVTVPPAAAKRRRTNCNPCTVLRILFLRLVKRIIGMFLAAPDEVVPPAIATALAKSSDKYELVQIATGIKIMRPTDDDMDEFKGLVIPTAVLNATRGVFVGMYHAIVHPYLMIHDDAHIEHLLNETHYARLITVHEDQGEFLVDMLYHMYLPPIPGCVLHGVMAHLRRSADDKLVVDRLEINGKIVNRTDPTWQLANIHFMVGMAHEVLFANHMILQLQNGYIEAALKTALPHDNPLALFLAPHFNFGASLTTHNVMRLYSHRDPASGTGLLVDSIYELIRVGFRNSITRGLTPKYVDTAFNRALKSSIDTIEDHVTDFVNNNIVVSSAEFKAIRVFVDRIRETIPFVPIGEELNATSLKELVTRIVHDCTFMSAIGQLQPDARFGTAYRIRRTFDPADTAWTPAKLFHRTDTFQRIVYQEVLAGSHCHTPLREIRYDSHIKVHPLLFKGALDTLQRRNPIFNVDQINTSVNV